MCNYSVLFADVFVLLSCSFGEKHKNKRYRLITVDQTEVDELWNSSSPRQRASPAAGRFFIFLRWQTPAESFRSSPSTAQDFCPEAGNVIDVGSSHFLWEVHISHQLLHRFCPKVNLGRLGNDGAKMAAAAEQPQQRLKQFKLSLFFRRWAIIWCSSSWESSSRRTQSSGFKH